jgi:hypothetical protein
MEELEKVQLGDVIAMDDEDVIFFDAAFEDISLRRRAAERMLTRAEEEAKNKWDAIYKRWPIFKGYQIKFDTDKRHIVVIGKY